MRNLIVLAILACVAFMSCKSNSSEVAKQARQQQYMIDSLKSEMTKKQIIDSVAQAVASQPIAITQGMPVASPVSEINSQTYTAQQPKHIDHKSHAAHKHHYASSSNYGNTGAYNNSPSYGAMTTNDYSAATHQRRGWNAKAKGAVIGAGAGAVAGALIGRKKGWGALIGGVLGAGAGTGVGAIIDSRN